VSRPNRSKSKCARRGAKDIKQTWLANKHQTNKETGDVSIPAKLKNYADRLRREFHSLNEQSLEILDELEAVAPALVNPSSLAISK
jgi:hypothetical protein